MPDYTRHWLDTVPPGTRAAKEIDDAAREFRVDVHERMLTVFSTFGEDKAIPVELKPAYKGNVVDYPMIYGPQILQPLDLVTDTQYAIGFVSTTQSLHGQIRLPVGAIIKRYDLWINVQSGTARTTELYEVAPNTGTVTSLTGSLAIPATSGIQLVSSAALSHTVVEPSYFLVRVGVSGVVIAIVWGLRLLVDFQDSTQR